MPLLLLLAGCGDVRQTAKEYGLGVREAPDEFAVIQNNPLRVPDNLNPSTLPEPLDTKKITASAAVAEAGRVLLSASASTSTGASASVNAETTETTKTDIIHTGEVSAVEQLVLLNAGANGDETNIRETLAAERINQSPTLGERILFWQDPAYYDPLVDPVAETARLKQLLEQGINPTGEGVPVRDGSQPGRITFQ
ncbi:MAG: DUF3035 domain-containing protein [Alphaproteobacteria bacterium]